MSRISDAVNSVSSFANNALEAAKTKLGFMPTVEKATVVVKAPVEQVAEVAVEGRKEPVVQKSRFERFKELARNNPAASIALLASAIFAAVYGVDKYLQHRALKNLENHLGSAGDIDQFPGASAILQAEFEADDRFMGGVAICGQEWKEMRRKYLNSLPNVDEAFSGAAKIAKQLNLAEQVEIANLVKNDPDLAFAYAANLPDAADAAAAKIPADLPAVEDSYKPGLIATYLGEQAQEAHLAKLEAMLGNPDDAFKVDDRFVSGPRMTYRGDFYGDRT